jgi:hypothetical protein
MIISNESKANIIEELSGLSSFSYFINMELIEATATLNDFFGIRSNDFSRRCQLVVGTDISYRVLFNNGTDILDLSISKIGGLKTIGLVVDDEKNTFSVYVNGLLYRQITTTVSFVVDSLTSMFSWWHTSLNAVTNICHIFNYALNPAEVSLLWNNGRPDKVKLKSYQKWGSNANLKPSQFKKGKVYKITNNTGSNFTLYGSSNNEIGTVFTCNNDFNITNNNGYAIQLGCVASYTSKGLVYNSSLQVNRWLDDSSNKLHADVSGNPLV